MSKGNKNFYLCTDGHDENIELTTHNQTDQELSTDDELYMRIVAAMLHRDSKTKILALIQSDRQQRDIESRLEEAKRFERATGKKFDYLCERVRSEPSFGNSSKGKKENFLDGAESMILLPSIRREELEEQLSQQENK